MAIHYAIRGKTERMILQGKRAALRDVYETLEFYKTPRSDVKETDNMTIQQLCERSGTCRQKIYGILEELQDLGLIKIRKLSKRGLYQFRLVHYGDDFYESKKSSESKVVELPSAPQQTESTETSEATGTDDTEPKRGFFGGRL